MSAEWLELHPIDPQRRWLQRAADRVCAGAVIAYPTDSCYALGCRAGDKEATERIRTIRKFDKQHQFTLVCRDLAQISTYARVDNWQYRLLRQLTPGPYTFVLEGTKELPRRVMHEKRKTIGIRVPEHRVAHTLLDLMGEPMLSVTLQWPDDDLPVGDPSDHREVLERAVDLVLDAGTCGLIPTTVLDLTGEAPVLLRQGRGDVSMLGL